MAHETFADELRAAVAGDKHTIYTELMLQAAELLDEKMYRPTPVAPVSPDATGKCGEPSKMSDDLKDRLVTVETQYRPHGIWTPYRGMVSNKNPPVRYLVDRSQAEELLATERAEREVVERNRDAARENFLTMQKSAAKLLERAEKAEADNAAKDARVKELEQINANLMGDDENKPRYTTKRLKLEIARATEAIEVRLAAAEKALEPFAEYCGDHFDKDFNGNPLPDEQKVGWVYLNYGHFRRARAVMGGK